MQDEAPKAELVALPNKNSQTTLAGLLQLVTAVATIATLLLYSYFTKTPLNGEAWIAAVGFLVHAILSYVKGAVAADAKNPVLRWASKFISDKTVNDVSNAIAKQSEGSAEELLKEMEHKKKT